MLDLILKFAAVCREADLRVSTAEMIDCAAQLELVDVLAESEFKAVLRANFAKSRREQKNFDRLYHLFFHELEKGERLDPETGRINETSQEELAEVLSQLADPRDTEPAEQAILDFLAGDPAGFLSQLRQMEAQAESARSGVKSNLGQLSGRLSLLLRINRIRQRLRELENTPQADGRAGRNERMLNHLNRRLETARQMLSEDHRPHNEALRQVNTHEQHYPDLGEKPFGALSEQEIREMREGVEKLVKRLKDAVGRRYAARNKGVLDVKQTLRAAGRFQGVPLELKFKNQPLRKARIVTLCDVSGSVWSAARFMLNLIYSLQDCFSDVNSFAFVCAPTNITEIFEKNEVNQAIEKIMTRTDIAFDALTDYGEVFYQFHRDHLHLLNRRTTLIIVGDGRSNYHHPRENLLEAMRAKCRRIVWLNPEPEAFWGTGDSEMITYMAYCHEVRPCRNLNQLIDFIQELIL